MVLWEKQEGRLVQRFCLSPDKPEVLSGRVESRQAFFRRSFFIKAWAADDFFPPFFRRGKKGVVRHREANEKNDLWAGFSSGYELLSSGILLSP